MADKVSKRDQTLSLDKIDEKYIADLAINGWEQATDDISEYLNRKADYETNWRDLTGSEARGPWENSANFKVPLTLTYSKAIHSRLWQLFSVPSGFYSVQARKEVFQDKEQAIKEFMDFLLNSWANSKMGVRREIDRWLWDVVHQGSGYIKAFWKREVNEYSEVTSVVETEEELFFDKDNLTGRTDIRTKVVEKEEVKEEVFEGPQIRRILAEDIRLPIGQHDPQDSDWAQTKVLMSDNDLKVKAQDGIFNREAVEEALKYRETYLDEHGVENDIRRLRNSIDGVDENGGRRLSDAFQDDCHIVYEWYGKAFIEKEVDLNEEREDVDSLPKEIIAWVHKGSSRVLGWTYLHRISPSGIRPLFKADFVTFPDRSSGVGVPELLSEIQRHNDAIVNMRIDNGTLASTPIGFYRASSGLKPGNIRIRPGQMYPVDDVNDVKMVQFPFLQGFGYQEEQMNVGYAEKVLAVSEIQLGRAPGKVGALRNATGANLLSSESGIQLEIHLDRVAYAMSRLLQFVFRLARERMPATMFYRVTGERGQPIFGKVNRDDLKGEFDFNISVDILGQSQIERQQQATLIMQTLINPAFTQTGVIQPKNLYALAKGFLKANKVSRIDDYITEPQDFEGEVITPAERIFRITVGAFQDPPIESTVRFSENHEKALQIMDGFQNSDEFGLLTRAEQLQAFQALKEKHEQFLLAQQAGGNPNMTGMQTPREGFAPAQIGAPGESALQGAQGEVNGPVV